MDIEIADTNWRKIVKPFLFMDVSWGEAISLVEGEKNSTGQLMDVGFGFQFSYRDQVNGNLQFAFPVNENFSDELITVPDDSYRVVFDLQYSFR